MEENKLFEFLKKHASKLFIALLIIACAGVWTERLFRSKRTRSQQDFLIANQIFERFKRGEPLATEAIELTENILKRHPELHPEYDVMLAATFLAQKNTAQAISYAQSTLDTAAHTLPPHYRAFAETSLLLANDAREEARAAAYSLHEELTNATGHDRLYALNLLRLVFLEEGEKREALWAQLEAHPAFAEIDGLLQEGSLTLQDYLADKKNN